MSEDGTCAGDEQPGDPPGPSWILPGSTPGPAAPAAENLHEPSDAVPGGAFPGATPPSSAVPAWGTGFREFHEPQANPYPPFQGPPRPSGGARAALIAGVCAAGVGAVVLVAALAVHHSDAASSTQITVSVPPMTFSVRTTVTIPLDGVADPGCAPAKDAISTATDDFGKDMDDPAAATADAQRAVDQASSAATAAQDPAVKSAVVAMKTHLVALHSAAEAQDFGSEASAFQSLQTDIAAVFGACSP